MKSVVSFLFMGKRAKLLVALRKKSTKKYLSAISKKIDSNYSYTYRNIEQFEEYGLLKTEKNGRERMIKLTEKGEKIADYIMAIQNLL